MHTFWLISLREFLLKNSIKHLGDAPLSRIRSRRFSRQIPIKSLPDFLIRPRRGEGPRTNRSIKEEKDDPNLHPPKWIRIRRHGNEDDGFALAPFLLLLLWSDALFYLRGDERFRSVEEAEDLLDLIEISSFFFSWRRRRRYGDGGWGKAVRRALPIVFVKENEIPHGKISVVCQTTFISWSSCCLHMSSVFHTRLKSQPS